ncbi:MAG: glycosyltransferase family A protein [Sulfolobales archaeon]|nr:glycosyltransferase family A protein [Sulfolobales archaeon]
MIDLGFGRINSVRVSVIIPSKGCEYLKYALFGLREQTVRPQEVVLVVKNCDSAAVERLCDSYSLPCVVVDQRKGFFTTALNIGRKTAKGDLALFTDDDAIAPKKWIERYVKVFNRTSSNVGCVSSRDFYLRPDNLKVAPTVDDFLHVKMYRWFIRPWSEPPLEILKDYRFGVYISKWFNVSHGPYIPDRVCLSLLYRGVNMAFRGELLDIIEFPEHPKLVRAPGNEQYVALQLILEGYKSIYIPNNPVLHIHREESLSRARRRDELRLEMNLMKHYYVKLLGNRIWSP